MTQRIRAWDFPVPDEVGATEDGFVMMVWGALPSRWARVPYDGTLIEIEYPEHTSPCPFDARGRAYCTEDAPFALQGLDLDTLELEALELRRSGTSTPSSPVPSRRGIHNAALAVSWWYRS